MEYLNSKLLNEVMNASINSFMFYISHNNKEKSDQCRKLLSLLAEMSNERM